MIRFIVPRNEDIQILPKSILGTLWLQTHFPTEHWESISANQASIAKNNQNELFADAQAAGLKLNFLQNLCIARKF